MKWVKLKINMREILYIALLFGIAHSITVCPDCSNDCKEIGFLDCSNCQCNPSCDTIDCGTRDCVMEKIPCLQEPCLMLPQCINFKIVCDAPLRIGESVFLCDDSPQCPKEHSCKPVIGHSVSVCCKEENPLDIGNDQIIPEIPGFTPVFEPIFEPDSDGDCANCDLDPCMMMVGNPPCPGYPRAQCVTDDCSCSSWFIDENAQPVECGGFPSLSPLPLTSDDPSLLGIKNSSEAEEVGYVAIQVVVATSVVFVLLLLVLLFCKFFHQRKKDTPTNRHRDQLKPLRSGSMDKSEIA